MKKLQSVAVAVFCLTLVLMIGGGSAAFAQDVTETITGTVTDQSGAAIAGATVTAKSVERGITYTAEPMTPASTGSATSRGNYELRDGKAGISDQRLSGIYGGAEPDGPH